MKTIKQVNANPRKSATNALHDNTDVYTPMRMTHKILRWRSEKTKNEGNSSNINNTNTHVSNNNVTILQTAKVFSKPKYEKKRIYLQTFTRHSYLINVC